MACDYIDGNLLSAGQNSQVNFQECWDFQEGLCIHAHASNEQGLSSLQGLGRAEQGSSSASLQIGGVTSGNQHGTESNGETLLPCRLLDHIKCCSKQQHDEVAIQAISHREIQTNTGKAYPRILPSPTVPSSSVLCGLENVKKCSITYLICCTSVSGLADCWKIPVAVQHSHPIQCSMPRVRTCTHLCLVLLTAAKCLLQDSTLNSCSAACLTQETRHICVWSC